MSTNPLTPTNNPCTLTHILHTFNTIEDMQNTSYLHIGDLITLKGFYDAQDGAGHQRIISTTSDNTSVPYGNYFANIVYNNELYSTWFGCKQDGETDDSDNFQNFLSFFGQARLIIPKGIIKTTKMLLLKGIFRNQENNTGNLSFREIIFRGAAIKYMGADNGCSVFIAFHFNSIIDGLTIHDQSNANYVNFCATWNSDFRNFHISNLYINENNTDIPILHPDGEVYYQFNMSFTRGDITRKLKITSTSQDTSKRTWLINSMFFSNIIIGAQHTSDANYCIELYGGAGLENVNFLNCDISYATKSLFYIDTNFGSSTINIKQCYLDSVIPLVEDFNFKKIMFHLEDNIEATNDSHQIMGVKLRNITNSSRTGNRGIEANFIPSTIMNLSMNGNLELGVRNASWLLDDGAFNSMIINSTNSLYGNAIKCIFNRNENHNGIHFISMPLPTTGTYTFAIRLKKISGTGILQLIFNDAFFKNFDLSRILDNEEVILSTFGNGNISFNEGSKLRNQLYAYGTETNLTVEIYEIILVTGTYLNWNLPIHPKARLAVSSNAAETIDLTKYYTKPEVDTLISSTHTNLSNYYTKSEVDSLVLSHDSTDLSNYYTKSETNNLISSQNPSDLSGYYTKNEIDTLIYDVTQSLPVSSNALPYYYEDIFFYKKNDLTYNSKLAKQFPDFNTKHIICQSQQVPLYDSLNDYIVSLLTKEVPMITHSNQDNQIKTLQELKVQSCYIYYYFTIEVQEISAVAPTLQLLDHNSTNTPVNFTGLTSTKGIQQISCAVGGTLIYEATSVLKPKIGITNEDIDNGRYITYKILGVYNKNILGPNENFIGDIKFSGDHFDGTESSITMKLNGNSYKLPILRGIWGFNDYIRNGKVYRRITKKLITPDMIELLTKNTSIIYQIGKKSSMVTLNPSLTNFIQSSDPWYKNNGYQWYIWSPTITTHPFTNARKFGGDADIRAISYGNAYGYEGTRIILKLTHSDIGYNYDQDPTPTPSELVEKYKVWVKNNPTYIYYPVNTPIEETLSTPLPYLEGNKADNIISFDTGSSLGIAPILRIKHLDTSYRHLSGKSWLIIGDSIMESMGSTFNTFNLANNLIPDCKIYNYGRSGSSICNYNNGATAWGKYLEENISQLPDYVDLITINLGINDCKTSLIIGELKDAPTGSGSLHAAFKSILLSLTNKYPLARIVILAPIRLSTYATPDNPLYQIIQAEKEEAAFFNLEFIDLQYGGGVNNFYPTDNNSWGVSNINFRSGWLTADGAHYNDIAHRILFEHIARRL